MNQHVKKIFLTLFFLVSFFYRSVICKDFSFTYVSGTTAISGQVINADSGSPLPARIVVLKVNGQVLNSYYKSFPGFFTDEDGTFILEGDPGIYTLKVYRGIDYLSQTFKIEIQRNKVIQLTIKLKSWVPLREMGWVNGDGHAHLYTNKKPDEEMAATVRQICRAQGVDFISANQGWAGFDENNWRQGYALFSDDAFLLHYGAEMPKYRTGHTWWLGLKSCRGYFSAAMDTMYEMNYYQSPENTEWDFSWLKFPNIPDVELVHRFKKAENAVAIMAHPCSWWWQKRGHIEKYTTNVVEYLAFGLLAGKIWDGMVVMGYDRDHYFYQNLWFHVLNEGYQMPALAELDGGYGPDNRFYYGSMRTFFYVGPDMTMETIADPEIGIIIIPYVRGNFSNKALANLLKLHGKGIGLLFLGDLPNKDKWYPLMNMQSPLFHLTHEGASITVKGLIEKVREINYPDSFRGGLAKGVAVSVYSPGEVILKDSSGESVLVRKPFGKGAILLAGCDTSAGSIDGERNYFQQPSIKDHSLVRLARFLEIEPVDVKISQFNVWKALISRNNKDYLIIYSHLNKPVKQTFTIPVNTRYGRYFSFFDKE